jgi:type I restriction enzyme S subunit
MADFNTITIEEATDCLIDYRGKTPPKTDSGVRLITAKVVKCGQILEEPAEYIAEDFYNEWMRRGLPQQLDVLITTEAPLGELAILRCSEKIALAQRIILLRAKPGYVDPVFLFYALQSDSSQSELKARGSGTTVLGIKQSELRKVRIPFFPLPVQRRIAGILTAYDELIENCQRRIRILEAMARALYREWFVHFRFPGHENLPRVASILGDIPQGWVGCFGDIATIERDGINPFEFPDEEFEHFSIPAFDNGRQPAIELGATILSGKYCIDGSTVLLSKLNPRIPRIWLPVPSGHRRAITSTEFLGLKPQSGVTREFIYAKCYSDEFAGQFGSLAIGTSTSHQRVKPEDLLAMPSAVPNRTIIAQFTKLVSPMLTVCHQLRSQIHNLCWTRDILLPRLLSGQVQLATTNCTKDLL